MLHVPGLYIAPVREKGRGVFCGHDLQPGDTIELCPLLFIPGHQLPTIHQTVFHDYYFLWPGPQGAACIALGYGSLYNHDRDPNAEVIMDTEAGMLEIRCLQTISAGNEILIDYTGGGAPEAPIWFQEV
ncbi:MAG: SET domain-containing protein-lysine N-methyltransferase [Saprospiraceae bacterium]|nr:SET domain-containing protein-lysine N-methyltransferase [Saprospiraceae bacterium]